MHRVQLFHWRLKPWAKGSYLCGSSDPSSWSDSSISIRLTSEEVKDFNCSSSIPFPQLAQHLVTFLLQAEERGYRPRQFTW